MVVGIKPGGMMQPPKKKNSGVMWGAQNTVINILDRSPKGEKHERLVTTYRADETRQS